MLAASQHTAPVQDVSGLLHLLLGNEVMGSSSPLPVAPALRCTIFLAVLFFGVYLTIIGIRVRHVLSGDELWTHRLEACMARAATALSLVPVLATLMIGTRLRAVQLAEVGKPGEPPFWAQLCMYAATSAFLARFLLDVLSKTQGPEFRQGRRATTAALYGFCAAIVTSVLTMKAKSGETEELGATLQCMLALVVMYFAEHGLREETIQADKRDQDDATGYGTMTAASESAGSAGDMEPCSMSLQFLPMLCVLFVGIQLRSVQLQLEPPFWAVVAMYCTTTALLVQVVRSSVRSVHGQEEKPQALLGDEAAGPSVGSSEGHGSSTAIASAASVCIYLGTVFILASVFAMESKPLSIFLPSGGKTPSSGHPISTAMRCVMSLTVVYFASYLILTGSKILKGSIAHWATRVGHSVQSSLAFAPMLCIIMIGARLRAMEVGARDPPLWGQQSMAITTFAVVIKVVCSMMSVDENEKLESKDAATKMCTIVRLVLEYIASVVIFLGVTLLMIALAWM
eukprot:TRINITY_DN2932_c0_g1_i1.p1 TRINITY_DN2932_c0_g1~~TRINITY_DN2932_c0_g1_i1.p1  ORF type:complete len:513 (-),score=111.58 TRINITY_DN2932_c0_g1_i1:46-1584(-)